MSDFTTWRSLVDGEEIGVIPDSDIYLQDDWGDPNLQDRDDSGTTTHNGVEGVYRPEWTTDDGSPVADDERLKMSGDDALRADMNLNLDEKITWEFTNIQNIDDSADTATVNLGVWSESTSTTRSFPRGYEDSIFVRLSDGGIRLRAVEGDDDPTDIVGEVSQPSEPFDVTVERDSDAEFVLLVNGSEQGSGSFDGLTDPQYMPMFSNNGDGEIDEVKVS